MGSAAVCVNLLLERRESWKAHTGISINTAENEY